GAAFAVQFLHNLAQLPKYRRFAGIGDERIATIRGETHYLRLRRWKLHDFLVAGHVPQRGQVFLGGPRDETAIGGSGLTLAIGRSAHSSRRALARGPCGPPAAAVAERQEQFLAASAAEPHAENARGQPLN